MKTFAIVLAILAMLTVGGIAAVPVVLAQSPSCPNPHTECTTTCRTMDPNTGVPPFVKNCASDGDRLS